MVSLPGQALAAQTLSIKGREERVKEMGVMSSSVHSPGDHVEESLPLPPGGGWNVVTKEKKTKTRQHRQGSYSQADAGKHLDKGKKL